MNEWPVSVTIISDHKMGGRTFYKSDLKPEWRAPSRAIFCWKHQIRNYCSITSTLKFSSTSSKLFHTLSYFHTEFKKNVTILISLSNKRNAVKKFAFQFESFSFTKRYPSQGSVAQYIVLLLTRISDYNNILFWCRKTDTCGMYIIVFTEEQTQT